MQVSKRPFRSKLDKKVEETALEIKERIKARSQAKKAHRTALTAQDGDPIEGLSRILEDVPVEIFEKNFAQDEDGLVYVTRHEI